MQITSMELWDTLEVSLIEIKNKEIDLILSEKIESLINHFNGLMVKGKQFEAIDKVRLITSTVGNKNFFNSRNIDKEDVKLINSVVDTLMLLDKVLVQEARIYKKDEIVVKKDRLPNIDNDKSLNILKPIK